MVSKKNERQNIRVAVRCRPINKNEILNNEVNVVESCKDHKIVLKDKSTSSRTYAFDRVFGPQSKQLDVYNEMVSPTIKEVIQGYNCTIFAYGQTGTGKTFTMTGERSDPLRYTWEDDPIAGIVPRALNQLFSLLESMGCDFSVRISFLELYNEEIFDLLSCSDENIRLTVYDDASKKGSVVIKGLREVAVLDKEEVYGILERGLLRRQTACTQLNSQSSRSHSVFSVTVHLKEVCSNESEVFLKIGKLNLVDLAGSENIGRSGAQDRRAREAGSINQSLLTLGRVITCLVDHAPHIPYRESKLTRLLQDSLGGKTKTSIIATISPGSSSLEETLSTLDYAHRAKNIQNRPEINQKLNKKELIKGYNNELERLRRDLEASRSKTGIFIDYDNYQSMQVQRSQQRDRIDELEERRELLEADIKMVKSEFDLSCQELEEIRRGKEKIEEEFRKCFENLKIMTHRLKKTKRCLKEEEFLRSQHQSTENKLHDEACCILTAANTFQSDTIGLHNKLDRQNVVAANNQKIISSISTEWLPVQLKEPISLLNTLKVDLNSQFQDIEKNLCDLQQYIIENGKDTRNEMDILSSALANILSTRLSNASMEVRHLANYHDNLIDKFQDKVKPDFCSVNQLILEVLQKLSNVQNQHEAQLKSQNELFSKLIEKCEHFQQSSHAWADLYQQEVKETENIQAELNKRHQQELLETEQLFNYLQKLSDTRKATNTLIGTHLADRISRVSQVSSNQENLLKKRSVDFINSISDTTDTCSETSKMLTNDITCISTMVDQVNTLVNSVSVHCNQLAEESSLSTKDCLENGACAELFDESCKWQTLGAYQQSSNHPKHDTIDTNIDSTESFSSFNKTFHDQFNNHELNSINAINLFKDQITSVTTKLTELEKISSSLPEITSNLSRHLTEEIVDYQSTGETPRRRLAQEHIYPTNLSKTAPHPQLLSNFRREHSFSIDSPLSPFRPSYPLNDITNCIPKCVQPKTIKSSLSTEDLEHSSKNDTYGSRTLMDAEVAPVITPISKRSLKKQDPV